jgi:hypothetical protein
MSARLLHMARDMVLTLALRRDAELEAFLDAD